MPLLLRDILVPVEQKDVDPARLVADALGLAPGSVRHAEIRRRSIDARRKPRLYYVLAISFETDREEALLSRYRNLSRLDPPRTPEIVRLAQRPPVVVAGMGPAGLFAALELARAGASVTLLERGRPVEQRIGDVERFWRGEGLDPNSNVQFGEGGAGTFSDGKLTTRINHPDIRYILQTLVDCGAPPDILIDAKPHIGSDRLRAVLVRFRRLLQSLDVTIRFQACLTDFQMHNGRVAAALVNGREELACQALVLAPGHSARDTYAMLRDKGVRLEVKPFAVGLRVAHPAQLINRIQYGSRQPAVGAADYRLAWNDPDSGRGIYSFCMCPGGEIINASSEPKHLVVNGMSRRRRDAPWSNSALVVSVGPEDFGPEALAGVAFQRRLEQHAWRLGGENDRAPAQNLLAFLGRGAGPVAQVCRPGVVDTDLRQLFPKQLLVPLQRGIEMFERKMRGFVTAEATLVGVESRTSAPVRILRGEDGASVSHPGLYPAGEGAGYAGGIMSAALDGIRVAGSIMKQLSGREIT